MRQHDGNRRTGINVSVPPARRADFFAALDFLKANHADRYIGNAPLAADAIIAYHRLLQTLITLIPTLKTGETVTLDELLEAACAWQKSQRETQTTESL
jgi:hypothetical protein